MSSVETQQNGGGQAETAGQMQALTDKIHRLTARVDFQERRLGEIEQRVQTLASQVGAHGVIVTTAQELLELLAKDDECWQVVDSLLNLGSTATKGRLHAFVAAQVGRPRPLKYIRQ
jgi:hypothetical protein